MVRFRLQALNALKAFEAAGRHGRMTKAAEELGVTHGAVSRQVRHLENVLGIKLFAGAKNRLTLTEAGRTLLPRLTAAFEQIEIGVRAVADFEEGVLDVSCPGTFMMRWLIPRLHRFNAIHPEIAVRLSASERPTDFDRERDDVAIRVEQGESPANVVSAPLLDEHFGPVLAPALARKLRLDRVEKLAAAPLLHSKTRPSAWRDWATRAGWQAHSAALEGASYEHFYFMLEAATAGLGVGISPWPLVIEDVAAGRLIAPFGFRPSGLVYAALRRPRRSRKAEQFCAWLVEEGRTTVSAPESR